jgi:hypothetical protein
MPTTFKTFFDDDITTNRDMLHEAVPCTGTIFRPFPFGAYTTVLSERNIKNNAATGMVQSVYDYPFLSSSANHIFDLTVGYSSVSTLSGATSVQNQKKINIYNQMAQVLVGHDKTGSIKRFDRDGELAAGTKLNEVFFINLSRLLIKDEIKKQSFSISLLTGSAATNPSDILLIQDHNAIKQYKVNSPAGEYGILYTSSASPNAESGVGLIYYQAGVVVLTSSVFDGNLASYFGTSASADNTVKAVLTGSAISGACDGLRNRISNIAFNNTTEINSTIYHCSANPSEFNYSTNPTYLSESQIRVKENAFENPHTYITTIGLYSADGELCAVAKLSEPMKKTPADSLRFRVRLDY